MKMQMNGVEVGKVAKVEFKPLPLSAIVDLLAKPAFDRAYLERDPQNLLDAVTSLLERVTYKHGWKFRVAAGQKTLYNPYWGVQFYLDYIVPRLDSKPIELGHAQFVRTTNGETAHANERNQVVYAMTPLTAGPLFLEERHLIDIMVHGGLIHWLSERLIRYAEMHEVDEWLKLDGMCIKEPHPEVKERELAASLRKTKDKEWFE